jgi:hypothetical protein
MVSKILPSRAQFPSFMQDGTIALRLRVRLRELLAQPASRIETLEALEIRSDVAATLYLLESHAGCPSIRARASQCRSLESYRHHPFENHKL